MAEAVSFNWMKPASSTVDNQMQAEYQRPQEPDPDYVGEMVVKPREQPGRQVPQASRGVLPHQLDLSVTQIAVMWILHRGIVSLRPLRSLTEDIVAFYPIALDAILQTETMREARKSDLRLIYFKGLIVAHTHPKSQMIEAIRRADGVLERAGLSSEGQELSALRVAGNPSFEDQKTLNHIADALGYSSKPSH
jgi:hypothetical protein